MTVSYADKMGILEAIGRFFGKIGIWKRPKAIWKCSKAIWKHSKSHLEKWPPPRLTHALTISLVSLDRKR